MIQQRIRQMIWQKSDQRAIPCAVLLAATAFAQAPALSRQPYQDAYRAWRLGDPTLERELPTDGLTAISDRADKAAARAATYLQTRRDFLQETANRVSAKATALEPIPPAAEPGTAQAVDDFVATNLKSVNATITAYARSSDRTLQQVRVALERERSALELINTVSQDRQRNLATGSAASESANMAVKRVNDHYATLGNSFRQSSEDLNKESTAWAEYYKSLADGARGVVQQSQAGSRQETTARVNPPAPATSGPNTPAGPAGTNAAPPVTPLNPAAPSRSITPVPLARYIGAWTYPLTNALFMGAQPEFVDLVVHEQNGQANGTLYARFKLPAGSPGDPVLRFDFAGPLQATRSQTFKLETNDGAQGSIELIPGPAFNLLEVNFTTDPKPGKVTKGNFVLVKK
jgi:hypothetical protein